MAVGSHLGNTNPAEYELSPDGPKSFRHSPESFRPAMGGGSRIE